MQAKECKARILALKEWRSLNGFSIEDVVRLFPDGWPSDTTIRRIFGKGGEEKSFRESTIAALELALLGKVYAPEIKIPVVDVVKAQEDTAKRLSDDNRRLMQTVRKQKHIIISLLMLVGCCVVFFGGIALYDFVTNGTGFWNSHSWPIWIAKVAFLMCVSAVVLHYFLAMRKLEAAFLAEEKAAAEAAL